MRATYTEEQEALAAAARDLAADGRKAARVMLEGGEPPAEPTASLMSGFAGLGVPEDSGGAGGGLVDLAILLEGLGRQVTPTPYVAHALATQVALAAGLDVAAAAAGEQRLALAVGAEPFGEGAQLASDDEERVELTAVPEGGWCDAAVVVHGGTVTVAEPAGRRPRSPMDPTRPCADLVFAGLPHARAHPGDGVMRATAALAADLVGVGRGAVDLACEYAKEREQFDQPIGRFQAVAHQLAEAFTELELAWSLVLYACWAVDAGDAEAAAAVHAAKAKAGEAAIFAAERCTQVHGGMGITWEADPHLYLRRAVWSSGWLGSATWHYDRLGATVVGWR